MELKIDLQSLLSLGTAGLILFIVFNWPKIEAFAASIAKLLADIFKSGKSEALRLSLQSELNQAIAEIDGEAPGLFDRSVKVKWLESGEEHINADRKGIFIRVNKTEDTDSLFLKSINYIFDNALLVDSRPYIHGHIFEGIKLVLEEKMLSKAGLQSALISFRKDKYNPIILKDKSVSLATNQLEFLDYRGLFTRVFLRECIDLYLKTGIGHEGSKPKWDVSRFLEFVNNLFRALASEGVRASFEYASPTLSIAFAILADEFTWETMGLDFYKKRTKLSIQRGANTVYLIALGTRNVKLANTLAAWLQSQELLGRKNISYYSLGFGRNSNLSAVCIRCEIQPNAKSKIIDAETNLPPEIILNDVELHNIIKSVIQDQDIEIIKSAWLRGYQAQVVVHSKNPGKRASQVCIGKDGITGKEITKLAGSFVRFVEWSPDLRQAIKNNLDTHKPEEIKDVVLDPLGCFAYVYVQSTKTIGELIGHDGKTRDLAEAITDYSIEIQVDPKSALIEQLKGSIPEVAADEIKILDLSILVGQEIRVLVSSKAYDSPASICGAYFDEIKTKANITERLYFCNKKSNLEESIVAALYPLKAEDVIKVISETPTKYIVVVKDRDAMARGIGTDGAHVRTAGRLLGFWIQLAVPEEIKE